MCISDMNMTHLDGQGCLLCTVLLGGLIHVVIPESLQSLLQIRPALELIGRFGPSLVQITEQFGRFGNERCVTSSPVMQ